MKVLVRAILTMAMAVSFSSFAAAQTFTILPSTKLEGADCDTILNQYEVDGKIPNLDATKAQQAAQDASGAKDAAIKDYTSYAGSLDPVTLADCAGGNGVAEECKAYDEKAKAKQDAEKASEDANANAEQLKANTQGDDRDNLLGCAIKTGRVSLQMVPYFITYVSNFLLAMVGIICVLFIVIGGYQYIYGGLIDQKEKGKKTIFHALMGMSVALLAWVIVSVIISAITS
jgi:hypothetical protein